MKHHHHGKDDKYKHLLQYGYMPHYVTQVDFAEHEREIGEVMWQRLNGNEYDVIRDFLDDLIHADMPDLLPIREEPLEPEEPEETAKAFYDMMAVAKKPLYEGAPIYLSQCR